MRDTDLDDYPERSVAMVRAFGLALRRALLICAAISVVIAVLGTPVIDDRVPASLAPVLIAIVGSVVGLVVGFVSVPTELRRAFEAYSWLGRTEVDRFEERTSGPVPTTPADIDRWLASTPSTEATRMGRIEVLAFSGRYDDARTELDVVRPTTPEDRFEMATLRQYVDWLETGAADHSGLAAALRDHPPGSDARRMGDVNLAVADARVRFTEGDPGWAGALVAARPPLGRGASMVTWRDTWLRFGVISFAAALIASIVVSLLR